MACQSLVASPEKLAGHSVDLINDPLRTWDTLDLSFFVLIGGKLPTRDTRLHSALNEHVYSLSFGRKPGEVAWSKAQVHANRRNIVGRWRHQSVALLAGATCWR